MVVDPQGKVGDMNTPSYRITNINPGGINSGLSVYGDADRTRAVEFLHEGIHGGWEEAGGFGSAQPLLGTSLRKAHQQPYSDAADEILGKN